MENWKTEEFWIRTFFVLVFYGILNVALLVTLVMAFGQWLSRLTSGEEVKPLQHWLSSLSLYIGQILLFITFQKDHKPFPFADWPVTADDPSGY